MREKKKKIARVWISNGTTTAFFFFSAHWRGLMRSIYLKQARLIKGRFINFREPGALWCGVIRTLRVTRPIHPRKHARIDSSFRLYTSHAVYSTRFAKGRIQLPCRSVFIIPPIVGVYICMYVGLWKDLFVSESGQESQPQPQGSYLIQNYGVHTARHDDRIVGGHDSRIWFGAHVCFAHSCATNMSADSVF